MNPFKPILIDNDENGPAKALLLQAYSFVEIFCGHAWVSRVMRSKGHPTAQMDILLTKEKFRSSPQNPMNLLTDSGFLPPVPHLCQFHV